MSLETKSEGNFDMDHEEQGTVQLKGILFRYLRIWPWFVLSIGLALFSSYVYLRYSTNIFETKAQILFHDQEENVMDELSMFSALGVGQQGSKLGNEMAMLKTPGILSGISEKLHLQQQTYMLGRKTGIRKTDVYNLEPFFIVPLKMDSTWNEVKAEFRIRILSKTKFELVEGEKNKIGTYLFGAPIVTKTGIVKVEKTNNFWRYFVEDEFIIHLRPLKMVVEELNTLIELSMPDSKDRGSDLVDVTIKGPVVQKNEDIIWSMMQFHKEEKIKDQSQIARNTSDFINERMRFLSDELSDVEKSAENFKSRHEIVDVLTDGQSFVAKRDEIEKELITQSVQLNLCQYLEEYMRKNVNLGELLPANLGFEDESVVAITTQYNRLVLDRVRLAKTSSSRNPSIQKIDDQIEGLRYSLTEGIRSTESRIRITIKSLNDQLNRYEGRIAAVPGFEREYRDIERQQQIKETLYVFLLQKREENEIKAASSIGNTKIIQEPNTNINPISPKRSVIYLASFLLGLLLPVAVVYLRNLLDTKVHGSQDLLKFKLPVLGEIPRGPEDQRKIVITKNARTHIAEAFRMVRSNLNFMIDEDQHEAKVILVTSSVAKEGKTFISINLCHTLAQGNKTAVVIGLDLRAPKIARYIEMNHTVGVTNYIVNPDLTFDDLTIKDPGNPNVNYIISGDIPPNPTELLMRDRLTHLIAEARKRYDYVILDTAPVALVSDSLHISKLSDMVIYVVRAELIDCGMLNLPASLYQDKKFAKMACLVNAVDMKKSSYGYGYGAGYGYGSGYGYGYGYGYGNEYLDSPKQNKGFIYRIYSRLLRKKK